MGGGKWERDSAEYDTSNNSGGITTRTTMDGHSGSLSHLLHGIFAVEVSEGVVEEGCKRHDDDEMSDVLSFGF